MGNRGSPFCERSGVLLPQLPTAYCLLPTAHCQFCGVARAARQPTLPSQGSPALTSACGDGAGRLSGWPCRKRGRVAEGGALLRRCTRTGYRGFESLRFRQPHNCTARTHAVADFGAIAPELAQHFARDPETEGLTLLPRKLAFPLKSASTITRSRQKGRRFPSTPSNKDATLQQ